MATPAPREHSPQYTAYIGSPAWGAFRARYIALRGPLACAACAGTRIVQLHHRHYRTLGAESPEDVTPLCKSCHENVHNSARQGAIPLALATDRYVRRFLAARGKRIILPPAGRAEMRPTWSHAKARKDLVKEKVGRPRGSKALRALQRNARALGVGW